MDQDCYTLQKNESYSTANAIAANRNRSRATTTLQCTTTEVLSTLPHINMDNPTEIFNSTNQVDSSHYELVELGMFIVE